MSLLILFVFSQLLISIIGLVLLQPVPTGLPGIVFCGGSAVCLFGSGWVNRTFFPRLPTWAAGAFLPRILGLAWVARVVASQPGSPPHCLGSSSCLGLHLAAIHRFVLGLDTRVAGRNGCVPQVGISALVLRCHSVPTAAVASCHPGGLTRSGAVRELSSPQPPYTITPSASRATLINSHLEPGLLKLPRGLCTPHLQLRCH